MNINENVSYNAQAMVKDDTGNDVPVMYMSANLDTGNMNININCNTTNKGLAASNAESVKAQYDEFFATVKARAIELGYVIY